MASGDVVELAGKSIVITGGTTGIGRATAKLLVEAGAKVLLFGRHQKELDDALAEIGRARAEDRVHGVTADQSRNADIERVFAEADSRIGGCDILINNAAVGLGSFLETKYDDWLYEVQTNLVAYIACCRYAIDRMKKKGWGHIVNVGSMSADLREPSNDVYVATKAGIQAFSPRPIRRLSRFSFSAFPPHQPFSIAGACPDPARREPRTCSRAQAATGPFEVGSASFPCLVHCATRASQ
ncbi:MAG TPA: SDR family oxidoreductase [Tepidisphaeraceae bacterium]|jgi:NAD(P)-dependent dehydrogenase (short-subunit alcohol dehydrogenase family)